MLKIKLLGIKVNVHNWIKKTLLNNGKEKNTINGSALDWEPVTSAIPQGLVLGSVLFIMYVMILMLQEKM